MSRSSSRAIRHYVSKLFQPQNIMPWKSEVMHEELTSRSQKLMLDLGIIRLSSTGTFSLLPLGERSLRKLTCIVDEEMQKIGAQKMFLPLFTQSELWKKTGRWDVTFDELFTLEDRHGKSFVLSPTHEEAITDLIASVKLSHRNLPLRLYQITSKFRDEMKPRFGLIRAREFIMKDLYTFDENQVMAKETYSAVTSAYTNVFNRIGVQFRRVAGSVGVMGGTLSHEFHYPASVGDDRLVLCETCEFGANIDTLDSCVGEVVASGTSALVNLSTGQQHIEQCPNCGSKRLQHIHGIEVGHTFLLGTKYSKTLNGTFLNASGKPEVLEMGSYGLGLTRILAAAIEVLSEKSEIRWPLILAPYKLCVIPPKKGSKESAASHVADEVCEMLDSISPLQNEMIIDDRENLSIGRRLFDAKRVGYPFVVVVGREAMKPEPLLELVDVSSSQQILLSKAALVEHLAAFFTPSG